MPTKHLAAPLLVGAIIAVLGWSSEAAAQEEVSAQQYEDGTITVIQPKPVLRRRRLQLSPHFGMTINDPVLRQWAVGGTLAYNATERFSVVGGFDWMDFGSTLGGVTERYEEVISTTASAPDVTPIDWFASLEFGYVPLYGKGVLFNRAVVFYDMYLTLGPLIGSARDEITPGGTIAVGFNLYVNRWLGIQTEFRERMTVQEVSSGNQLTHTVTSTLGLTIFLPFNFRYTYDDGAGL